MRHLLLALLGILLISFLFVYKALSSPLSQFKPPAPRPQSVISYAGEIIEWIDNRDKTSIIMVYCEPQHIIIRAGPIDNKHLRKLKLNDVIAWLDQQCQNENWGQ